MQPFVKNGITLLSGVDPQRRCQRIADTIPVKDRTLYFCPSPLYGYGLEKLLSRLAAHAPASAILCIEADPELYELSKINFVSSLSADGKLRITNIHDAADLYAFVLKAWGARAFRRIETVRLTGGFQLFGELYDSLCESLQREIATDWSNALTMTKLGRLYIRNALRNLSLIHRFSSIENLSFGFSPTLVLGAGPSLDETLDALESHFSQNLAPEKRSFKIVCADTCLGALKDRKIMPDLAVILESQHWNLRDFTGCKGWEVRQAVDLSALPQSADVLAGQGYLFMTPWTHLKIFERLKKHGLLPAAIPPLGSVGLTAVELARRITSGNIICAGLDFSFTADKYHARSTPGHRSKLNSQTRMRSITNAAVFEPSSSAAGSKTGITVRTSPSMRGYRNLFEQEFSSDPRIYDIAGSGLPLGLKTLSPEEAAMMLAGDSAENRHEISQKEAQTEVIEQNQYGKALLESKLTEFFSEEKNRLYELRSLLSGEKTANQNRLDTLIDECDYLWAHFPDYTGGRTVPSKDSKSAISFFKRVRAEIDPMIASLERR